MNTDSISARFAGALFVTAIVASLVGGTLIQTVLGGPDAAERLSSGGPVVILGVVLELINALAVIGIAAALSVPLGRSQPGLAAGYLGIRIVEATVCATAALIPVIQLRLTAPDDLALLTAVRDGLVGTGVPVLFGAGALLLYLMLHRSGLVPRYLVVWGLVGAVGVLANVFVTEPALRPALVLPIITSELFLGGYLMVRGLRRRTPEVEPVLS
ncbi:DUF4386 domain-containing protein [Microlunatus parietis]|uniref:DUF4386 domain-containing protein n=1 Tax=Microlunatus parietis TaxID=682979 RepID=A0A7Y9IB63_9ACTN|nr:DUF4386 domain-containing protein [Microlunatus parietis]NYE73691.1 hypothetical protein [Microlunatus parietis]